MFLSSVSLSLSSIPAQYVEELKVCMCVWFFSYRREESLGSVYYNRPVQNTD